MAVHEIVDSRFGAIVIERTDAGRAVRISGETIPAGSITRIGGAQMRGDVPIGTRNPRYLHLELDGRSFEVRPAAGRLTRRSYRIDVAGHGTSWLWTPATRHSHQLLGDERATGRAELGIFTAHQATITARWSDESHAGGSGAAAAGITGEDCALGYLLAAGFGTGAQALLMAIFHGTVDILIPG